MDIRNGLALSFPYPHLNHSAVPPSGLKSDQFSVLLDALNLLNEPGSVEFRVATLH